MKIGAVILAGGQSRRMGRDKKNLKFNNDSFLDKIKNELTCFDEKYISVADNAGFVNKDGFIYIADKYSNIGPLGAIATVLESCTSDFLFVIACDMPLFEIEYSKELFEHIDNDVQAIVPRTPNGRVHPLCCIYSKSSLDKIKTQINNQEYKIRACLDKLSVKYVDVEDEGFINSLYLNVNTPKDYVELIDKSHIRKEW